MLSSSLMPTELAQTGVAETDRSQGIARKVRVELRRSGYAEMRRVEVNVEGDALTLSGIVFSFHMKQTAQEIVRQAFPAMHIQNRLQVVSAPKQRPK